MRYNIVRNGDHANVVVFIGGVGMLTADSNHPNFASIEQAIFEGNEDGLAELFDPSHDVAEKFRAVSERVSVGNGRVYFDGDEVNNALTDQILRFLKDGVDDWQALVKFFENLAQNPNEHSRENLYRWLRAADFTIDEDGLIVGYKGVHQGEEGEYRSLSSGTATVNGVSHNGRIPQRVGDTVEMPRSNVQHDPSVGCHVGLHVGTWDYASNFGSVVIEVRVNPRDVVSVPTDCGDQKMRTCRYKVTSDVLTAPHNTPLVSAYV